MVSNRTSSGVNTSLWDPHFASPMFESTLGTVDKVTFMSYKYIGEMLLNIMLSDEVTPFWESM